MKCFPVFCITLLANLSLQAAVVVSPIFSDHMVLQKGDSAPVWGTAAPGEEVTVTLGEASTKTKANPDGKWSVALDVSRLKSDAVYELLIHGENEIRISDVVLGEVWIASGQSNMEFALVSTQNAPQEIAVSTNPLLRQFYLIRSATNSPVTTLSGSWSTCSPDTAPKFTAVGYYFGKMLQKELGCAVGIINTNWGGTPVEAWTRREAFKEVPDLEAAIQNFETRRTEFPEQLAKFKRDFPAWIEKSNRADQPDDGALAAPELDVADWVSVQLTGSVQGNGLPEAGVTWYRTTLEVPVELKGKQLAVDFNLPGGFNTVYWNGKRIGALQPGDARPQGDNQRYNVALEDVRPGTNVLAIRVYHPLGAPRFATAPRLGSSAAPITSPWKAKGSIAFPALDKDTATAIPRLPAALLPPQNQPSALYNGMIAPLIPYAIRGAIWYQGENNVGRAWAYRTAFPLMIKDWRAQWKQGDFPFYFCQLANYQAKSDKQTDSNLAELRDAQSSTLALPNTGQAVLIDIGESGDIHPRNKKDVGERLARIALVKDYGKPGEYSGPVYDSMKVEGDKIRLQFKHLGGGLVARPLPATYDVKSVANQTAPLVRNSPNSELEGFLICGSDKKWVWADAKIDGDSVVVSSKEVPAPVAVRYAWQDNPTCNLYNKAGLPASPFRTDDFPAVTLGKNY